MPVLAAFAVSFAVPFLVGIYLSFTHFRTVDSSEWVGIANYIRIFTQDETFLNSLWLTVKFTAVSIISVNVIAFSFALLLTKGLKGTDFFRTVFFMPNLIGGIVLGYIWKIILDAVIMNLFGTSLVLDSKFGFWGLIVLVSWHVLF